MIRRRFAIAASLVVLFALGWWAGRGFSRDLYPDLDLFVEVVHKVEVNYVDPVEPRTLIDGAISGMLRQLDPHSQYLDAKAYANLLSMAEGSFGGIGVEVDVRDGYPTVIAPIEGTPAWEAGLRSGDVLVAIDGKSTYGLAVEDVSDRLRGAAGTQVKVRVSREGEPDTHEVELTRRIIERKAVPYAFVADRGIGYLRLTAFSERSGRGDARGDRAAARAGRDEPGARPALEPGRPARPGRGGGRELRAARHHGRLHQGPRPQRGPPLLRRRERPEPGPADGGAGGRRLRLGLRDRRRGAAGPGPRAARGQPRPSARDRCSASSRCTARTARSSSRPRSTTRRAAARSTGPARTRCRTRRRTRTRATSPPPAPRRPTPRRARSSARRAGRTVYGGGGITPDVVVTPDTLTGLLRRVESRNLAFRFANRWLNTHPQPQPEATVEAPWDGVPRLAEAGGGGVHAGRGRGPAGAARARGAPRDGPAHAGRRRRRARGARGRPGVGPRPRGARARARAARRLRAGGGPAGPAPAAPRGKRRRAAASRADMARAWLCDFDGTVSPHRHRRGLRARASRPGARPSRRTCSGPGRAARWGTAS